MSKKPKKENTNAQLEEFAPLWREALGPWSAPVVIISDGDDRVQLIGDDRVSLTIQSAKETLRRMARRRSGGSPDIAQQQAVWQALQDAEDSEPLPCEVENEMTL